MLRLLVDFLSGIIRVLAVVCIAGGAFAGYIQAPSLEVEPWAGALIGFAAGFLAATVGAGLIACFILIENHLRVLADAQLASQKPVVAAKEEEQEEVEESALERAERIAAYTQKYRSVNYDPSRDRPARPASAEGPGSDKKDDHDRPAAGTN